jgi:RNA polymerase sigma factor (sigma-70 family)
VEVSTLRYSGPIGLHGRSPLVRLQSDERLIVYVRKGNSHAFEVLVSRYHTRLLSFCRHLLGSREDAEDVLQEVFAAAFNAIQADDRPINVRPWLYRIARNRSLNHLRRAQAVGVDSMDVHLSDNGASTADKVHEREEFRMLVGDIQELPETQRTALVLREMDALSYEQIAEAMETTVSSVKSLLVRARVSLAEAAEARLLSCDEVRIELGEVAEGLRRRPTSLVRRHLRSCKRCTVFRGQLKQTNKALAALLPIGPMVLLKKLAIFHLGHSAASGSGATATGAAGQAAAVGSTAAAGAGATAAMGGAGGFVSAGVGAIATKAAAGLAVAGLVTAGAVEVSQQPTRHSKVAAVPHRAITPTAPAVIHQTSPATRAPTQTPTYRGTIQPVLPKARKLHRDKAATPKPADAAQAEPKTQTKTETKADPKADPKTQTSAGKITAKPADPPAKDPKATTPTTTATPAPPTGGKTQTQTDPTVLPPPAQPAMPTLTTTAPPTTAPTPTPTAAPTTTASSTPRTTQASPPASAAPTTSGTATSTNASGSTSPTATIGKTFTGTPKVSASSAKRWRHWRRHW